MDLYSLNINKREKEEKIKTINSIPYYKYGKGLPIGNMTSQILGIFYLNDVDHYIKEKLKFKYYIRYMDDILIIDTDRDKLLKSFNLIEKEINKVLGDFLIDNNKGLLLNKYEIEVLNRYNFDYRMYSSLSELIFDIDNYINESSLGDIDDLEEVLEKLYERHYYNEVNK